MHETIKCKPLIQRELLRIKVWKKSTAYWPARWMSLDIIVKERARSVIKDIRKVLETFHIWWTPPKMLQTSMTLKMIWMISYEVQYKPSLSGIIRALNMLTSSTCILKRERVWISSGHSFGNGLGFGMFYMVQKWKARILWQFSIIICVNQNTLSFCYLSYWISNRFEVHKDVLFFHCAVFLVLDLFCFLWECLCISPYLRLLVKLSQIQQGALWIPQDRK